MTLLALVLGAMLTAVAGLHAAWALGSSWPAPDRRALSATVVGSPDFEEMPGAAVTLAVVVALMAAVWLVLAGGGVLPWPLPVWMLTLGLAGLALVLLGRGAVTYLISGPWRTAAPVQPFARLDRMYYAPLCLLLGAGVAVLLIGRM